MQKLTTTSPIELPYQSPNETGLLLNSTMIGFFAVKQLFIYLIRAGSKFEG